VLSVFYLSRDTHFVEAWICLLEISVANQMQFYSLFVCSIILLTEEGMHDACNLVSKEPGMGLDNEPARLA
jgi:hypothetical protein